MPRLTALYVYPVKSCRGIAMPAAAVDSRGLVGDRRFLVVDANGRFLTQRVQPRMALIETAFADGRLTLAAAGQGRISVPLAKSGGDLPRLQVVVWNDTVPADDCGEEAAAWLSGFLGLACRLVHAGSAYSRPIPTRKIPPAIGPGVPSHEVTFADAYPFLVISEESLADLNGRLESPLPMNRFRPNLVVAGDGAYAEDGWGCFRIGSVVFHGANPCIRCVVTTTDQATAVRGVEPLRTLATYRRVDDQGVKFGRNAIHETKTGHLAVGDAVELLDEPT